MHKLLEQFLTGLSLTIPAATLRPEMEEPVGANERTRLILGSKRCPHCRSIFPLVGEGLVFLTANREMHSESYRIRCADGHEFYVTIFLLGTDDLYSLAQDEVMKYLPTKCANRTITYTGVNVFPPRHNNHLQIVGRCGAKARHEAELHNVNILWYEKPGWFARSAID